MHEILAKAMFLGARKDRGIRFYLTLTFESQKLHISGKIKITCIYLKKQRFWNNGTWILVKYAIFGLKISS